MLITPTLLLAGCERTLNALLARDPAAPARLAALAGSRLLVRLEKPHLALLLWVELTPETLSEWLSGASIERLMFDGKLAVRGRIHLLEATRDLLFDLDIDWESELARWLGDMPAHSLPAANSATCSATT